MSNALIDEIKLAYQSQNLKPIRGLFSLDEAGIEYVCPLICLAAHRGITDVKDDEAPFLALEWAGKTFGRSWVAGFLDGFDDLGKTKSDPEYLAGHALGVEAAQQLCPDV